MYKLGMRVKTDGRTAIVVGRPEMFTSKNKLVKIKFEDSTRIEDRPENQLKALPKSQQYPEFGGSFVRPTSSI